ncbi:MAG: ABC transporter ATP-binding protein [Syntrophales bacterium]|nr:ABC transporter ATP-binding protein [Syntrophales bacterium]
MNVPVEEGSGYALVCKGLTKRFGGLDAVNKVDLRIAAGERRALIGPNGAGKTTLFSLISGLHAVTSGSVFLFGKEVTALPSHKRAALGLARTFQITNLFPTMTVIDSVVLASLCLKRVKFSMLKPLSRYRYLYQEAEKILERVGMAEKSKEIVRNLSHGEQRQIEIALALVSNPKVLLLDEPTAGLSPAESGMMARMIHGLDPAITVLIIEHDMDVALQVADLITVLHRGEVFEEGCNRDICSSSRVQEIYFGAEE